MEDVNDSDGDVNGLEFNEPKTNCTVAIGGSVGLVGFNVPH